MGPPEASERRKKFLKEGLTNHIGRFFPKLDGRLSVGRQTGRQERGAVGAMAFARPRPHGSAGSAVGLNPYSEQSVFHSPPRPDPDDEPAWADAVLSQETSCWFQKMRYHSSKRQRAEPSASRGGVAVRSSVWAPQI